MTRPPPLPFWTQDLASVIDRTVVQSPDREALSDSRRRYTYGQLDRAVDQAAARFAALGVAPGERIACCLPNGCDIVIAFLATQRLGAIWVGLNAVLPPAEKARLIAHSGALLLLADEGVLDQLEQHRGDLPSLRRHLLIDPAGEWLGEGPTADAFRRPAIDPHAPAAINYTSGTTGQPKGVVHSQHTMLTPIAAATVEGIWGQGLRRGVVLPLTITNVMVLSPLLAFLYSAPIACGVSAKIEDLAPWGEAEGIEVMSAVPTMVYDLVGVERAPSSLKMIMCGGAPLPPSLARAFHARYGFAPTNSYGLTEAPTMVTDTGRGAAPEGSSGRPAPHIEVKVRDAEGRPAPAGEVGDICLEARTEGPWKDVYRPLLSYWDDAERTRDLAKRPWFVTGDVGRLDDEGWLFVTDRRSDLILRGGANIFPQEIVRVLERHPHVQACAVVGVPDPRLGERTMAFVQPTDPSLGGEPLLTALREACRQELSKYKWPDSWVEVDHMPRNAMGKILLAPLRRRAADLAGVKAV